MTDVDTRFSFQHASECGRGSVDDGVLPVLYSRVDTVPWWTQFSGGVSVRATVVKSQVDQTSPLSSPVRMGESPFEHMSSERLIYLCCRRAPVLRIRVATPRLQQALKLPVYVLPRRRRPLPVRTMDRIHRGDPHGPLSPCPGLRFVLSHHGVVRSL
jgi:hypothetical protein